MLEGIPFSIEESDKLSTLIDEHGRAAIPFAAIGGFTDDDVGFNFVTSEFEQEEDLLTGKLLKSSIGTYHNNPVDIEELKNELHKFSRGVLISGNA